MIPHRLRHPRVPTLIFLTVLAVAVSGDVTAQTSGGETRDGGIKLLESGNAAGAVDALRLATRQNKNDFVAWHWLAVAFERQAKTDDARKAHEKAAKLGEAWLIRQVSAVMSETDVVISIIKPQLALTTKSAETYIKLSPRLSKSKTREWAERVEFLRDLGQFPLTGIIVYKSVDLTTKALVLDKPEPAYTEEARENQTTGTVILRAIFAEDGRVRGIVPIKRLPYGLTEQAVKAARGIKFIPATKDGRKVSTWIQLEYYFNLY